MASVFVSFDWDHDRRYKFLLEAWNKNPRFQFVFSDATPGEIDTNNVGRIKAALTAKINAATHTLVIFCRASQYGWLFAFDALTFGAIGVSVALYLVSLHGRK